MQATATHHTAGHEPGHGLLHEKLTLSVITPEATVVETTADFVVLPLFDGELGIGPGHTPLIGRLGFGEMRVRSGGKTVHYYLDGGFVQVVDNNISVLTSRAIPAASLDAAVLEEQLRATLARTAHSDEAIASRDKAAQQLRAQLRIAQKARS